ncbi:MAG: phosphodiester glycosidase family protein [Paludibacteraceae bacterium]|nr:phosphodiester glycosidase family protein [Paludibacteraceae bacterium]
MCTHLHTLFRATSAMFCIAMLLCLSAAHAQSGHGTVPVQTNQDSTAILIYQIDTLESYPVGPGVVYTRFIVTNGSSTRNCYIYDVDLSNPYIRVEETHAATIGKTEAMVTTHQRLDAYGHRSIGSVNCNFWETTNNEGLLGVACTGQVSNGKIGASITNWGLGVAASLGLPDEDRKQELGFLMIDRQGKAWVDQYGWNSGIRIGQDTYPLREANRNRTNPQADEIVLFNSDLGTNATRSVSDMYEVLLELTDDSNWAINTELHGRVISANTTGGTLIGERQAVLQGRGTGKTFLQKAAVGDTVALAIGIYSALTEEYPQIEQLSAGNCYVMKNYRLLFRNWAEQYNNQNYPRTGFGVSEDHRRLWMMVMEKPGMFTHEMCSILRHFGACYAMGADGGGSAQFNLGGKIINPTTEGSPRAVSNAIFLFSTAPDDDTPASLLFADDATGTLNLPSYAAYTPHMRAYNQYGVLTSDRFTDYTLSCQPASLGTVSPDGKTFTASPAGGDGVLIVSAGMAVTQRQVHIEPGELSLALDSIICDLEPYTLELYSTSPSGRLPVDPAMAEWQVADPMVAAVEAGVLLGLTNGSTMVYGTLGGKTDSLLVRVQIAAAQWMKEAVSPFDTVLNYTTTRGAYVEVPLNCTLYGRPSAVVITVTSEPEIKSATVTVSCANTARHTSAVDVQELSSTMLEQQEGSHSIHISPDIFTGNIGAGAYPFFIEKFKCMFTGITKNTPYRFAVTDVVCYYDSWQQIEDALPYLPAGHAPGKVIIGGQLYILHNNLIYDIHGKQIR